MQSKCNKIWTPANIVTLIRICALPFWFWYAQIVSAITFDTFSLARLWSALIFMALSATDKLDGYLARSRNEVTVFGMFLDPIADKLLVLCGLLYLLEINWISVWIVLIIIAREFIVSGLRMVASERGVVIPAANLGKWKTAITLISISLFLIAYMFAPNYIVTGTSIMDILELIALILMYIAVVLTVISGVQYIINSKQVLEGNSK